MQPTVLIPARMESSRFPGKPLAPILGKPMIVRCAQNALEAGLPVLVCTDNTAIADVCSKNGIESIVTPVFQTGTDRVHWAWKSKNLGPCINLQGDEPLLSSAAIKHFADTLISEPQSSNTILNGLACLDQAHAFDPNNVKAAMSENDKILYLTRKPIRNSSDPESAPVYLKQIGLYGFSESSLAEFSSLPQSRLELAESVEMLRWMESGHHLKGLLLDTISISVDTPEDLLEVESYLSKNI
jgi:3-deoxy-manno-octulosonate cytidylyltransferase (CMP-KDO synthetase)